MTKAREWPTKVLEEFQWVAAHPRFGKAIEAPETAKKPLEPADTEDAPSRAAVNMLRYFIRRPNEFWRLYIPRGPGRPTPSKPLSSDGASEEKTAEQKQPDKPTAALIDSLLESQADVAEIH